MPTNFNNFSNRGLNFIFDDKNDHKIKNRRASQVILNILNGFGVNLKQTSNNIEKSTQELSISDERSKTLSPQIKENKIFNFKKFVSKTKICKKLIKKLRKKRKEITPSIF